MTRTLTPPAPVSPRGVRRDVRGGEELGPLGTGRRARHAQLPDARQDRRGGDAGAERAHGVDGDPHQQGGRAGQSQPRRPSHVAPPRHPDQRERPVLRHVLSRPWPATAIATPMSMRSTTSATRASSTTASRCPLLTSRGSEWGSITAYANGIVGRGVLLDAARYRGVDWLEPGEAVTRAELEAIEKAAGRAARRGRHPRLPHRPSCPPSRARRLEQRISAGGRGQGRPARRYGAVDA